MQSANGGGLVADHLRPTPTALSLTPNASRLSPLRLYFCKYGPVTVNPSTNEVEMNTRPEFAKEIKDKLDSLLRQAGEAKRALDNKGSEAFRIQAWDALPEPKLGWNYYSNIIPRNNLLFYRDTHQFDKAVEWLAVTRDSYGPGCDEVIEFMAATLWFEMGDFDKAYDEFDRQYKAGKTRPFQGQDKKYLDFYLKRELELR